MRYYISLIAIMVIGISIFTACQSTAKTNPAPPAQSVDGVPRISLADAKKAFDDGNAIFVDTRAEVQFNQEHVKGAINIPAEAFQTRYAEVPKDKKIITYCS
jgi:predicted sulfurtransferase